MSVIQRAKDLYARFQAESPDVQELFDFLRSGGFTPSKSNPPEAKLRYGRVRRGSKRSTFRGKRVALGLTQKELASRVGVKPYRIHLLEATGEFPKDKWPKLHSILGTDSTAKSAKDIPHVKKRYDRPDFTPVSNPIVTALRKQRLDAGLTKSELSEKAGLSRLYVSSIESGKRRPTYAALVKLAVALSVPVSTFGDLSTLRHTHYRHNAKGA